MANHANESGDPGARVQAAAGDAVACYKKTAGLQVVGEVTDPANLPDLLNQTEAQWVIVSIWPEGLLPGTVRSFFGKPLVSVYPGYSVRR